MRISDWSSDVCSSDLRVRHRLGDDHVDELADQRRIAVEIDHAIARRAASHLAATAPRRTLDENALCRADQTLAEFIVELADAVLQDRKPRSEEHTSELQSLMRISYAVFCLTKKTTIN